MIATINSTQADRSTLSRSVHGRWWRQFPGVRRRIHPLVRNSGEITLIPPTMRPSDDNE